MGRFKTFCLMTALVLLFVYVGGLIDGENGAMIAFVLSLAINFYSYFFSDKIVLSRYKAKEVNIAAAPEMYKAVKYLVMKANLPMPKLYIIDDDVPNAFATGRNHNHAAVAVTTGLLKTLDENELAGVLAHELSHIKHYDILTGTIASVFAGTIATLSNMLRYSTNSGYNRRTNSNANNRGGAIFLSALLMPIAASIVQLSISRTREYAADEGSARLTKHPEWLVSALQKLEDYSKKGVVKNATQQTAHMFIINPFSNLKSNFSSLFSTHPSTAKRIARLQKLMKEIR